MQKRAALTAGWMRGLRSPYTKAGFALCILYALYYFNRINAKSFAELVTNWPWLLYALLCMLPSYAIVAYRFWRILRLQGIVVPFRQALRWTMIGSLLDIIMPSSSGGDLVKAGLVVRHVGAGWRTQGVMSVAFDRLLGLLGMFLLAGVAGVLALPSVLALPGGRQLMVFLLLAPLGALLTLRIIGARRIYGSDRLRSWQDRGAGWAKLYKLVGSFNALREKPQSLALILGLSMANHVIWCAALFCITVGFGYDIDLLVGYALFPLALFGNVFGVAGGFGLGTVGFALIFEQFFHIGNGAAVGLTFQTLSGISRLAGLPFYLCASDRGQITGREP